ncbi:SagB/ThcOx family dehydrogenase [Legionella israelensis]|uniref:Putative nitroreductase n=1 Tax=Legionella israelensis TaxID=454 RepID=A0A0W0V2F1_9GAMM|nr:SagB/ThcOx family dehydrogenase [Legionella israelensis]KTD14293.1 putative nitroreductase [Legionella israelensis]QBS10550.1 SagB/ThcOx family dehydrogenase [Legionella israelensis]SCX94056.1 SagB-type dehydrogenase domain-containing protein [Legionella israelensis DSM 19235]STX57490.1 putative nitroreductase [Legionella israelensis]
MLEVDKKKTFISSHVENYIDSKVHNEVSKAYAKECISLIDHGFAAISSVEEAIIERVQFTECEISPFHKNDIDCSDTEERQFHRQPSSIHFSSQKMNFIQLQSFLIQSFSPDEHGRRPYPSAGGLYPVEPLVFLFEDRIQTEHSLISGCYHFRPVSRTLQLIKPMTAEHFYSRLLHHLIAQQKRPAFCLLYLAHLGKSIFKYRYRGYRHAVMEAGSMYQQAIITSQALGLSNTVWSSFAEYEFLAALGLDPGAFMPLMMQLFGYIE